MIFILLLLSGLLGQEVNLSMTNGNGLLTITSRDVPDGPDIPLDPVVVSVGVGMPKVDEPDLPLVTNLGPGGMPLTLPNDVDDSVPGPGGTLIASAAGDTFVFGSGFGQGASVDFSSGAAGNSIDSLDELFGTYTTEIGSRIDVMMHFGSDGLSQYDSFMSYLNTDDFVV